MNRKNLLLAALALLLVALGNWLTEQGVRVVDKRLAPPSEVQQDYFLNNFSITTLDDKGQPRQQLQAASLSHYSTEARTELQQLELTLNPQGKGNWRLSAEEGWVDQQQEEIWLQGKVSLLQSGAGTPMQLTTSTLHLQPSQGKASTDQEVTLKRGGMQIKGVGMRLEESGQRLTLLSQVRGHYASLAP